MDYADKADKAMAEKFTAMQDDPDNYKNAFHRYAHMLYQVSEQEQGRRQAQARGGMPPWPESSFTCPVDGLYFFSYTIQSYDDNIAVLLSIDGVIVAGVYHDEYDTSDNSQASNSALVTCFSGQEVYLYHTGSDGAILSSSYRYTTFSGFLIREN